MTKAFFIDTHGDVDVFAFRDHDLPDPAGGEVRVRHTAIGLNFIDIYMRTGLYPVSLPAILGSEAAGVVEALGDGVDDLKVGDRVVYCGSGGAYAQVANVAAGSIAKLPDTVSDETAAAVFLKGLTAEMLVNQVYSLKSGDTCLVYAAAGGVGTLLCQWAKHIGARVIAIVGKDEKVAIAKANGASDVIVRTKSSSIANDVRGLTGGIGVNVVYDSVGAGTFEASLDSLAMRGHMVTFGNASGPVPAIAPLDLARRGSLSLTRPTLFHYATPDRLPGMAKSLFEKVAAGVVDPKVGHRFPLSDVGDAHRLLESGASTGAIVLTP